MGIMRMAKAELRVLDLEESVNYYTNVIGLDEVGRSEGKVYFKAWDEFDHHSLIIQEADSPGLDHFAFKVEKEEDLAIFEKKIEQFGCTFMIGLSKSNHSGDGPDEYSFKHELMSDISLFSKDRKKMNALIGEKRGCNVHKTARVQ